MLMRIDLKLPGVPDSLTLQMHNFVGPVVN